MKALLLAAVLAQAQTPAPAPLPQPSRADAHVVLGWQNLHKEQPQDHYNDWLNDIFYAGAGAGWYWTVNLKTQVDIGTGTHATQYRTRQVPIGNNFAYESSQLRVGEWAVTLGQQYQFFHNAWFHPHVGAGVELARETTTEVYQPVIIFGPNPPTPREILPARTEGPNHQFIARGMSEVGFKAYMTRRSLLHRRHARDVPSRRRRGAVQSGIRIRFLSEARGAMREVRRRGSRGAQSTHMRQIVAMMLCAALMTTGCASATATGWRRRPSRPSSTRARWRTTSSG
jgi:hypothetical protein